MTDFTYETEGRNMQAASWHELADQDWGNWDESQWRGCYAYVMSAAISIAVPAQNVTKIRFRVGMSLFLHYRTAATGIIIVSGTALYGFFVMILIINRTKINRAYSYKNRLSRMPISGFKLTGIPPPKKITGELLWQTYIMVI